MFDVGEIGDLASALRWHTRFRPARDAVTFVVDPDDAATVSAWRYADLDRRARTIAARLQRDFPPGSRFLLLYPPGLAFTAAFFGCVYAAMAAVPAPLPERYPHHRRRVGQILDDADVSAVLTGAANGADIAEWARERHSSPVPIIATDEDGHAAPEAWSMPDLAPGTLALLQYTSGSTRAPRGVMITHGDLLRNVRNYGALLDLPPGMRHGGWIPMYHDMGLIGVFLAGVLLGHGCVLMSPNTFVRRPYRWLRMIDRYDVGCSPAPNFAFDLCCRRVDDDQVARLDLSRWDHAVNGSEPVQASSIETFTRHFARAGFRAEAMAPCYGLAEATLLVSGASRRRPVVRRVDKAALARHELRPADRAEGSQELVGCGRPIDIDLRVADPASGKELPDGRVGEIRLRHGTVARGYWRDPDATAATFGSEGGTLRTGDLGVIADGELYVIGRLDERAIVNGRNLYPQDIEHELRLQHPELTGMVGAAFTVPVSHREALVVTHEIKGGWSEDELGELSRKMRLTVAREFGAPVHSIALLPRGAVRRTTSGKIERREMRRLFLSGELKPLYLDSALEAT